MNDVKASIKVLVEHVLKAIQQNDLGLLKQDCVSKEQITRWVKHNVEDNPQAAINAGHKAVDSLYNDLEINNHKLKALNGIEILEPEHWRFYERSHKNFLQYDVSVFFTVDRKIIVAEFIVAEFIAAEFVAAESNAAPLGAEWCLTMKFNLKEIDSPIQRQLNDRQNSFLEFQSATRWPTDTASLIADKKIDNALKRYQDISIKYKAEESPVGFSEIQNSKALDAVQTQTGKTFPDALITWWLAGSIKSVRDYDRGYGFELFSPDRMQSIMENQSLADSVTMMGLAEVMDYFHSGEFKRVLSSEDYDALNIKYTVFGVYYLNDSDALYIYFDDDHKFGVAEYNHDWAHFGRTEWDAEYRTRLTSPLTGYTLPQLVADLLTLSAFQIWMSEA